MGHTLTHNKGTVAWQHTVVSGFEELIRQRDKKWWCVGGHQILCINIAVGLAVGIAFGLAIGLAVGNVVL